MRFALVGVAVVMLSGCAGGEPDDVARRAGAATGLRFLRSEETLGFARATTAREFEFPLDHGAHPEFQTEWWYFTGNLTGPGGRPLGFQLTFFRFALQPGTAAAGSAWRGTQTWMAHFALTDGAEGRFFARERMAREAIGLAGATATPLRVWVKDWSMSRTSEDGRLALHLEARDGDIGLALDLAASTNVVAHGERGLDRKGPEPGNASYYYSIPRLAVTGSVTLGAEQLRVTGSAWMDREWGTSALSQGVTGWDWFALQLPNGASLMFYGLRQEGGGSSPYSSGTFLDGDGGSFRLGAQDVELDVLEHWTSGVTGARYPVAWSLRVPRADLGLVIQPLLAAQELNLSVRYWEGAVRAEGLWKGRALDGVGYVELTGY